MVTNNGLTKFKLLNLPNTDRNWIETYPMRYLDFATLTDGELMALAAKYPDWLGDLAQIIPTGTLQLGGTYFNTATTIVIGMGGSSVFVPVGEGIAVGVLTPDGDKVWGCTFYDERLTSPPAPNGILNNMVIPALSDITYLSGTLPSYLVSLTATASGLKYINLEHIPATCLYLDFQGCRLDSGEVDGLLVLLDDNGATGGEVNLRGANMDPPSGIGDTAKTNLIAKGWQVSTN